MTEECDVQWGCTQAFLFISSGIVAALELGRSANGWGGWKDEHLPAQGEVAHVQAVLNEADSDASFGPETRGVPIRRKLSKLP